MAFGSIKGITIEFNGDTTKLDKALRDVSRTAKTTQNELKQIDKQLKFNPRSVDMWKQKQTVLNNAIKDTTAKLEVMKKARDEMSKQGLNADNSEEFRKLSRDIEEAERDLKNYNKQLKAIGNANLQALGHQFKDIGSKMTSVGKSMTMYISGPLAGIGAMAAKGFAEVDKTMQLTNSTMGNTKAQADLLNQAMKDAAANSTYSMNDAATATLNFARAGLTAEEAAAALAPAMNLAAGEGGNLDTVSGGLVATINGFHGSFDEATRYADVFANACNNSALDIDSLSQAMSVAAPVFSAAGYSVEDAALYMGVMANNGIEADKAANSLKTGMARLVSPSAEAAGWMDKLGINITNADGSMKDSVTVQKELHDAFAGLSESEQIAAASAIFGKNQMSPWLALINTAPGDVDALSSALMEEGTAAQMSQDMMSGFGGSLEKLKSSIDVAAVSLGEALAPMISKVADVIQKLVDWFNNLSPSMQKTVAVIGVIVAAIGPLLVIIGTLLSSIGTIMTSIGQVIGIVTKIGGVILKLLPILKGVASVLMGPWGIAIAVAVAAGILLYKNWDTVKAKAQELWAKIKEVFTQIKEFLSTVWDGVKEALLAVWDLIVAEITMRIQLILTIVTTVFTAVKTVVTTIWNGLVAFFTVAWDLLVTIVTARINLIKTVVTTVFNLVKQVVTTVWNAIKAVITQAIDSAKTKVQNTVNSIKNTVTSVFNTLKSTVSNIWNGIKSAITTPLESAKNTVSKIVDKIKSFFPLKLGKLLNFKLPSISIGTKSKSVGGKTIKVPDFDVNWYARGGIFDSPTMIGVGEAGQEAVVPLDKFWNTLEANNKRTDSILQAQTRILVAMLDELQKDKDFKIDGRVAGRIINDLVRV